MKSSWSGRIDKVVAKLKEFVGAKVFRQSMNDLAKINVGHFQHLAIDHSILVIQER